MVEVADGVSLRLNEAGKPGDGPVLVFIPGWSTGGDIWHHQVDTFAKNHRVIAFDPRSQGESTKTTSGNTPEIRALIDRCKDGVSSRFGVHLREEIVYLGEF